MRLRLPRRTARLRLTLLYSGMFLLLGTVVIFTIFAAVSGSSSLVQSATAVQAVPGPVGGPPVVVHVKPFGPLVDQRNSDLGKLLGVSWVVLAITALGAAVLGWFVAGRVLRPLRSIAGTARTISAGNLHARLALSGPDDEFKQLGDTLDELLARLEASFEAQRKFVANASHELRTPLTVERTLLQVALADPNASAATLRSTCEEVLAAGVEQERLLESLLTLASSERGLDERERLDLALIAAQAIAAAQPELERRSLALHTELAPAAATGDNALVERLVANLVENAVDHNADGGRVEVRTATDGSEAVLTVSNSGAVIAPGDLDRLLEPFQRLDTTRHADGSGHHGLGLSIVRAIASAHGAAVDVAAQPAGGLMVTVRFHAEP